MQDIVKLSLCAVRDRIADKTLSAAEVTRAALAQIDQNMDINAYITVDGEGAMRAAAASDERLRQGLPARALEGVPIALKDNICTQNIRTTCASKMLECFVPSYEATVVKQLRAAGAVILGKTNMDEFAMGSTNETSYFGPVKNPVDITRVPGGSSGGSAAAAAGFLAFGALGSDTGGSIRQPASYCGVVGLKPTYSAVSRSGVVALASSLDQVGPIARSVSDTEALFAVITGDKDPLDATSAPFHYRPAAPGLKGKRVGVIKQFFNGGIASGVKSAVENALKQMEQQGATLVELSIDTFDAALATYYILSCAEGATNLARFDGVKYGYRAQADSLSDLYINTRTEAFGAEVKRRIMMGNYVLSSGYYDAYYLKALKIRTLIKRDFEAALSQTDFLAGPVSPVTAPKLGQKCTDTTESYLSDVYTVPVSISGLPALSIPCGTDESGLPVGLQLIGRTFGEAELFAAAKALKEGIC